MSTFEQILDVAKHQEGYVANYQVDVSRQMFSHLESSGRLERVHRGVYRASHFPISEDEQYIVSYLWSRERGVISHESALAIHELSDVLPRATHVSYPPDESLPRGRPEWLTLHRAEVPPEARQWYGTVPITTPPRTLIDLAMSGFDPELFEQALDEAADRGLVGPDFERRLIREMLIGRISS